ncbi:MAG: hypothetical protein SPL47_04880 [Bacteroidales bacterium]|nr:hypothetical protein [Bacteroidales bacterium]
MKVKSMLRIAVMAIVSIFMSSLSAQNDRATFGLKGNVTKASPDRGNYAVYPVGRNDWVRYDLLFSNTGKLEEVNGMHVTSESFAYEHEIQRDSKNRISKLSSVAGEGLQWVVFHYDAQGRVASEDYVYENLDAGTEDNIGNTRYYYDENSNVVKVVVYDAYDSTTNTVNYTYRNTDANGNWTERVANCPNLGLNNQVEKRTLSYSDKTGAAEKSDATLDATQTGSDEGLSSGQPKKRPFWDFFLAFLLVAALIFMIAYMVYILLVRDRKLLPKTIDDFKAYRQEHGLSEESSDTEDNHITSLFEEVFLGLTHVRKGGEEEHYFTTKEQIEGLRSALVQTLETAPTHPECVDLYNEMLAEYKTCTKRQFMGSKPYLIIGGIVTVLMTIGAGLAALPFTLLNILGYYFASQETQFMINAKELKEAGSSDNSKLMTFLISMGIGVLFSGQTVRTVTKWSDGTTTTEEDGTGHLVAFIIGMMILFFLASFMFVVALINFVRNYLLYK